MVCKIQYIDTEAPRGRFLRNHDEYERLSQIRKTILKCVYLIQWRP
jgi:hypothetical protein